MLTAPTIFLLTEPEVERIVRVEAWHFLQRRSVVADDQFEECRRQWAAVGVHTSTRGASKAADPVVPPQRRRKAKHEAVDAVEEVIAQFNRRYSVVNEGGHATVFERSTDPVLKRWFYQRTGFTDFGISI